jgi:DNA polymerase-3 subunit epsilon
MREIVLDVETTGLSFAEGDRVVEIGCVELVNQIPSGRHFHVYLNPDRPMPAEAERIHGLNDAFLADKPRFADIAADLAAFLSEARLIAHNAAFDVSFLNGELIRVGHTAIMPERVVDSLALARRRHAGASNSLDALCQRYGIDISHRTLHGGLLDAQLLAEVYIELIGGRQAVLGLAELGGEVIATGIAMVSAGPRPVERGFRVSTGEEAAHRAFLKTLGNAPLWLSYLEKAGVAA